MKKILIIALAVIMLFSITACNTKTVQSGKGTEKSIDEKTKKEKEASEKQDPMEELKKNLNEIFPEIVVEARKILIENDSKIDKDLDMKKTQILLLSNLAQKAYLINSQNEKFAKPEENIEYSIETLDPKYLTRLFGKTQINDRDTYIFNIDFFARGKTKEEQKSRILHSMVHEGIHVLLQPKLRENGKEVKELGGIRDRAVKYPLDTESRIYRAQQGDCYKKALEAKTEEERIEWIKKGNYFYKKFLEINPDNLIGLENEILEGQAVYYEYRALALLQNSNQEEKELEQETRKIYLDDYFKMEEMLYMSKVDEFYAIGSLGYANIYALGQQKEFNFQNPSQYLVEKYGVLENEGDGEKREKITQYFEGMNKKIKPRVDQFKNQMQSNDYKTIKISAFYKYEQNGQFSYSLDCILYPYKGKENILQMRTQEIRLGDNRILLNEAESMIEEEKEACYIYVNIPNEDIEIEEGKITVQSKEVQLYDCNFTEKDGMFILEE